MLIIIQENYNPLLPADELASKGGYREIMIFLVKFSNLHHHVRNG
ncbi:hypothetical protein BMF77_04128 [Dolichospermum sp. UHCC 0315A]|nr:hypothetical protein BMF77_04128 [Dolichospermum sp. UHCC 0315A]